ncbi:MAG: hypothetical protein ACKO1M_15650 [Planctomycetota bacterium]
MPPLPDSLRHQLAPVIKHHFWILAVLAPLLFVPALFMAAGQLKATIDREKATIDGHASALNAVRGEPDHPNDAWVQTFDGRTEAARNEILQEWQGLWESQAPLRSWPAALGPDFLASVQAVGSGTRRDLQFRDLQRYQNTVPDLVRQLPARMGCPELMTANDGEGGPAVIRRDGGFQRGAGPGGEEDTAEASQQLAPLEWKGEDQKRLFVSFAWDRAPSTTQVLLAQEELWVYGLFCDTINRMNKGAKGAYDASITLVDELAVGYPAAEEKPGGRGAGRILGLRDQAAGPAADSGLPPEPAMDMGGGVGAEGRPPHPRFSSAGGSAEGFGGQGGFGGPAPAEPATEVANAEGAGAEAGAISPDDMLKQWIYVDFSGKPLTAPELVTAPDATMVHLMPFILRVIIDQRQVDRLLADLAGSPIPIDVRQLRVNPPSQLGGEGVFGRAGGLTQPSGAEEGGMSAPGDRRRRPFDVTLELRGTVGLATPPNPAALGAAEPDAVPAESGGGA